MNELDLTLSAYDYELPKEQIAQNPVTPRDSSRLLVVNSKEVGITPKHHVFSELSALLLASDLLILNNTKVFPARLYGKKLSGVPIEILLLQEQPDHNWLALVKPGRRIKVGTTLFFPKKEGIMDDSIPEELVADVLAVDSETSGRIISFRLDPDVSLISILDNYGHVPLPPYITDSDSEMEHYQTVYAKYYGSAAAPTAGLHFTANLLSELQSKGIEIAFITLHVGVGTFRPVEVDDITNHQMHKEWLEIPLETIAAIQKTKFNGGRVIAVGTTVVRALEGVATQQSITGIEELQPYQGQTNLFIYPGYEWKIIDGMITNFHLPRSSLMMLVSALIGRQRLLELYQIAIAEKYRFYSFGDAMLVLPVD